MAEKKINVTDLSRKVCSRVKEHETRTTTVVTERKYKAHSGLKFNSPDQKLKVTVPKPFSFDTGPKNRKVSPCRHSTDRSVVKETNGETKESKGKVVRTEVKTATENLKIPKETRCSKSRSVSRERVQKETMKDDSTVKKPAKCSRAEKPQVQPSKAEKSPALKSKSVKSASNASKTEEKATKITKSKTQGQAKEAVKPQVHFSDTEKSGVKVKDCGSTSVSTSKSDFSTAEVASYVSNLVITEESGSKAKFNGEQSEFLNGTGIHFEFDSPDSANGINLQSELANAAKMFETSMSKSASKIPRKEFAAHSGIKFPPNLKEEIVAEQLDFESRCTNFKMAKSEVNQMQITSMVNN